VLLEGRDVALLDDTERTLLRRRRIGFIFQAFNLLPTLTAIENVALPLELDGMREAAARERAFAAMELVDITHRQDHVPSQMSGGEQQRVAIARAIAKRPDVLLCDEPTGALDVETGIVVLDAIDRVNRELGTTTAVITHNAVISRMSDRIISLSNGLIHDVTENSEKVAVRELVW
jgi:putative ABC transport system ATP-binding protein